MKSVNNYKQMDIEKQRVEIEDLKDKCKHIEDVVDYINSLNQSEQGEPPLVIAKGRANTLRKLLTNFCDHRVSHPLMFCTFCLLLDEYVHQYKYLFHQFARNKGQGRDYAPILHLQNKPFAYVMY